MHQPRKPGNRCSANHKLLVCSRYIHSTYMYVFGVEGGPEGMELKGFDDAMMDSSTGLTHAALTGERKQSVGDAERMLSFLVAKFLREHGYNREANYIDIVAGWHEAADGRGLTALQRCKRNYAMLNMILDEWMPWHREIPDLSTIDINRPLSIY